MVTASPAVSQPVYTKYNAEHKSSVGLAHIQSIAKTTIPSNPSLPVIIFQSINMSVTNRPPQIVSPAQACAIMSNWLN